LLLVSDLCPASAAAENSASPDPSLVAAVRVFGREQWASALLDGDPATLRILLQARDSDLEPRESVELAVKKAEPSCRMSSSVRLCWELEEPKGPKGPYYRCPRDNA